ncbi:hypothetical protein [Desulfogranum marinum]|uniref:hypothetical protein n=1 Tax=Desulfogranum marinum TaxID=453220 RepID=UPI0029C758EB|nr:hypothetical protein [Desulfogranum marinum]
MYDVNAGDVLCRVDTYELYRSDRTLTIKVQEVLTESVYKFRAIPCVQLVESSEQYKGMGGTGEGALNDCLVKIKHMRLVEGFFP